MNKTKIRMERLCQREKLQKNETLFGKGSFKYLKYLK